MKRRIGSTRRQVLDLEVRESSPRRAWKNKYQQVAVDQSSHNGEPASASKEAKGGRIVNLVGYRSESDGEDEPQQPNAVDSKVNDFLKEIHSLHPTTTTGAKMDTADPTNSSWQLCYDESTGYPYYWNVVTNAVTWEPPPEVLALQSTMSADSASSAWAVEEAALGLPPRSNPNLVPKPSAPSATREMVKKRLTQEKKNKKLNGKRSGKRGSDSEEEKIEMITSWADEDSEDEEKSTTKKVKKTPEVKKPGAKVAAVKREPKAPEPKAPEPKSNEVIGPHLPPEILKHRRILDGLVSSRRNQAAAEDQADEENKSQSILEKLRRLKAESSVPEEAKEKILAPGVGHSNSSSGSRSSRSRSRSSSPGNLEKKRHKTSSDGDDDTRMISHLKRQAQMLKELADIPESSQPVEKDPDDIIKLIEMEQPPDHNKASASEKDVKTKNDTPSSIALIAGYGDDSEGEDTESVNENTPEKVVAKTAAPASSLFPIMQHSTEIQNFVENQKVLKPEVKDVPEVKPTFTLESNPLLESGGGVKRKKRLAVPTRLNSQVQSSMEETRSKSKSPELGERTWKSCVVLGNVCENEKSVSASEYSMKWCSSYTSDPSCGERRGFGFQDSSEEANEQQKGKVLFVKAETINEKNPSSASDDKTTKRPATGAEKDSAKFKGRKNLESKETLTDLATLVTEKIQFLTEGRDPVEPVQVMSIQAETLVAAWQAGSLDDSYFARWLEGMGTQLVELEKKAAPEGWDVHWDRTYKRYFYWNSTTNETQWEYPLVAEKADIQKSSPAKEVSTAAPDEDAMEICTTPPPDEMEQESFGIQVAVQPAAVAPTPPSEPPKGKGAHRSLDKLGERIVPISTKNEPQPPPPPPPPSSPPPPPPPPETPPPPPPSAPPVPLDTHGEPLPPGVDTPDLPYVVARPTVTASRVAAMHPGGGTALATPYGAVGSYPVMPTAEAVMAAYAPVALSQPLQYVDYRESYMAAVPASVTAPPFAYTAPAQVPIPHPTEKTALISELNSFYSDLALIKSEEDDRSQVSDSASAPAHTSAASAAAAAPRPTVNKQPETEKQVEVAPQLEEKAAPTPPAEKATVSHRAPTSTTETKESSLLTLTTGRKKEKTKLGPGLALKKKGVSNLVAKWQQVRQEVWKDYQDWDNGDDSQGAKDENDGCDNADDR